MTSLISKSSKTTSHGHTGSNPRALAQLFKLDVEDLFNKWNADKPLRVGFPHASSILAPEADYCLRKLVMLAVHPDKAMQPEHKPWDSLTNARFKHGWMIHEKIQGLLLKYGKVVVTNGEPELDLTHFDETRLLYFSPDAIIDMMGITMPVEIKGYKSDTFDKLDEDGTPPKDAWNQVNLYMHLLQLQYALILVECKNTQKIKVWCVEYNREMVQPYIDRMRKFQSAYIRASQGKPLPERCCKTSSDRNAEKCAMRQFCFSMNDTPARAEQQEILVELEGEFQ